MMLYSGFKLWIIALSESVTNIFDVDLEILRLRKRFSVKGSLKHFTVSYISILLTEKMLGILSRIHSH